MYSKDRVKDTTTTTGTGNITLSGSAPTGFQTFNAAFGTGVYFGYCIQAGSEWETGIGHLSASTTMVRDTVFESSNSNAAVSFSAGTKNVFCTLLAQSAPPFAFQAADLTATSDDTLGDTDLVIPVISGGLYDLTATLYFTQAASGDPSPQVGFNGGSATFADANAVGQMWSGEDGSLLATKAFDDVSTAWAFTLSAVDFVNVLQIKARLRATSTGTFMIQFAQAVSSGDPTKLKKLSVLYLCRIG